MAKKPTPTADAATPTITVELTEEQRNIVLNGLTNELLDAERYLSGSKEADKPGPLDSCCDAHLQRYEHRRETYRALKQQKKRVEATIALFSAAP